MVTRWEPLVYDTGEFINKYITLTTTNRNGKIIDKKRNCERKNWKRKISYWVRNLKQTVLEYNEIIEIPTKDS